ncbi:MAG: nodulation protein NfeD [Candidatus Riflebacteria bacterium]|nr:nodulation protein NfeD [Candidatus Riflebacteria bacterium]
MKSRNVKLLRLDGNKDVAAKSVCENVLDNPMQRFVRGMGFVMLCVLFAFGGAFCPVQAQSASGSVLVLQVHKEIDKGLSFFIQRQLRRAELENVSAVILEINSNGGLVDSAQEIKDALLRSKVSTLAYVKGRALSAAALVAISCHRIFMEPGSEMGAATPIMLIGGSVAAAEEKYVSAFRAEFRASAEARKRPPLIAEAMVDKNHDSIEGLSKKGEILTLTSEIALKHGYCDHVVASISSVLRIINLEGARVEVVEPTSAEWVARYLTNPNISVILFTIGFWCLIIEFFIAGFGIIGWTGVACLALFFGGHLFAYLAGFEALILFVVGLALLLVEILVLPGFGVTGVSGIIAICFSIVMVFGGIYSALSAIASIITYSVIFLMLVYWWGPKLRIFDRFILKEEMTADQGFVAADNNAFDHLLNLEGIATSPCRPSGKVKVGDERYDAVSDGDFIEKGARVVVRKVEGTKIVVRQVAD